MVTILSLLDFQLRLLLDAFEGIIIALSVKVSPSATIMLFVFIDISVTLKNFSSFSQEVTKTRNKIRTDKNNSCNFICQNSYLRHLYQQSQAASAIYINCL